MIQEFDISITAVGDDKYLVRTEQVAPGVPLAQEQVQWPVADWLQQAKTLMHDPLLGLLKGQSPQRWTQRSGYRSGSSLSDEAAFEQVPSLVSLGQDLYNKLFCGMLRDSWLTAQGVAQNRRNVLRLRIGIKDNRLQQLPWEVLHAGDRPLATGTDVTFSRYYADMRQGRDRKRIGLPDPNQPLRVLMVIAAPSDQERLELKHEVHHLQTELAQTRASSADSQQLADVQVTILEQPGRAELAQALEQGNFQVLHYAGHSNLGNAGGDLYLVSRQTGLTESLSGEDLAGLLVNNGVKLAVFNSCRGAYTATEEAGWQEQNLAQALINRGVPSVLAMAERIPDDVAITFTRLFYRNLKQGHPVDLSLNRTRQGLISAYGSFQFYWALPILHMQPTFDGYLTTAASAGDTNSDTLDQLLFAADALSPAAADSAAASDSQPAAPASNTVVETVVPAVSAESETAIGEEMTPPIPEADLDALVEELEYDELLRYDEDPATAELVEELTRPAADAQAAETALDSAAQPAAALPAETSEATATQAALGRYDSPLAKLGQAAAMANSPAPGAAAMRPPKRSTRKQSAWWQRHGQKVLIAGGLGVAVIAIASVINPVGWLQPESTPQLPAIGSPSTGGEFNPVAQGNLALLQDDLGVATQMVGLLIGQNNLEPAMNLLMSASEDQRDDPVMLFLLGRVQWGLYIQGEDDYDAHDAMTSWQAAVEANPRWTEALTALGFAYYAERQPGNALEVWSRAIELAGDEPFEAELDPSIVETLPEERPLVLNAYAGLAMIGYQLAQETAQIEEFNRLMQQSADYQLKILKETGTAFSPAQLGDNWLWTEAAVSDWREAQAALADYAELQSSAATVESVAEPE
ncbi:MAG: CHAT domain-containing protein [Leptolyngbya sp. SIO4C1]|nr:CHAT domain-containing protein [Leptolyngbya sp. SIO4C1]